MKEIKTTSDYSLFERYKENRKPKVSSIEKLKERMKHKNFLSSFPVVVKKNSKGKLKILDGQHRFIAAKELKKKIYYVIDSRMNLADIPQINTSSKNWSAPDYLHYYSEQNVEPYARMKLLYDEYGYSVTSLVGIAYESQYGGDLLNIFKDGELKIDNYTKFERDVKKISNFKRFGKFCKGTRFVHALTLIINLDKYDHKRMLEKMELFSYLLFPQATVLDYIANLTEIYNHKTHEKNRFNFLSELAN
jgi:hypothetical protein